MNPPEFISARRVPVAQFPKERPMLYGAPMVRGLRDDTKTNTRRVVKPCRDRRWGCELAPHELAGEVNGGDFTNCPYGQPGDRLWVRETARCNYRSEQPPTNTGCIGVDYRAGGSRMQDYALGERDNYPWFPSRSFNADQTMRWAPAIHMPRWASRITLEISAVRVERLQDISEADAIAEGIEKTPSGMWSLYGQSDVDGTYSPRASFRALWESIYGAGSWEANPWVWVVSFRRITP